MALLLLVCALVVALVDALLFFIIGASVDLDTKLGLIPVALAFGYASRLPLP